MRKKRSVLCRLLCKRKKATVNECTRGTSVVRRSRRGLRFDSEVFPVNHAPRVFSERTSSHPKNEKNREESRGGASPRPPSLGLPPPPHPRHGPPPLPFHSRRGARASPMSSDDDPRGAPSDRAEALATAYGSPALRRGGVGRICESVGVVDAGVCCVAGARHCTKNKASARRRMGERGTRVFRCGDACLPSACPGVAQGTRHPTRVDRRGRKADSARCGGAPSLLLTHTKRTHPLTPISHPRP